MRKTAIALAVVGALTVAANAQAADKADIDALYNGKTVDGITEVVSVTVSSKDAADGTSTTPSNNLSSVFGGVKVPATADENADSVKALKKIKTTTVKVTSGAWDKVIGGNSFKSTPGGASGDDKLLTTALTTSKVYIGFDKDGKEASAKELESLSVFQLAGGSHESGNTSSQYVALGGNKATTEVTIAGGTFGGDARNTETSIFEPYVVAGDAIKLAVNTGVSSKITSRLDSTTMTITGGTFDAPVVGGSMAMAFYANIGADDMLDAQVKTSTLTITGGTFKHAVTAAGYASAPTKTSGKASATSTVGTANLTVKGGKFENQANIYAGGIANANATVGVTTSNITINGAAVQNIYGTTGKITVDQTNVKLATYEPTSTYVTTNLTLTNGASAETVVLGTTGADDNAVVSKLTVVGEATLKALQLEGTDGVDVYGTGTLNWGTGATGLTGTANICGTLTTVPTGTGTFNVASKGTLVVEGTDLSKLSGKITLSGGTLQAATSVVFKTENTLIATAEAGAAGVKTGKETALDTTKIDFTSGTLAITDEGVYTKESLKVMMAVAKAKNLGLTIKTAKSADGVAVLDTGVVKESETTIATVTKNDTTGTLTLETTENKEAATGGAAIQVDADVTTVKLEGTDATLVAVGTTSGGKLFTNANGDAVDVSVGKGVTLKLGRESVEAETQGTLQKLVVGESAAEEGKKATVAVANIVAAVDTVTLKENAVVNIGNDGKRGELVVNTLEMAAGSEIFLDPVWDGSGVDQGSWLVVTNPSTVGGKIAVGHNSVASYGATKAEAQSAIEDRLNLNWGTDVTAALYVGKPITVTGSINVNGEMEKKATYVDSSVEVAKNSLLAVNQKTIGSEKAAITGATVTFVEGSLLGIVNAEEGSFTLSSVGVNGVDKVKVVTDTPFIKGAVSSEGKLTNTFDAEGGLGALASTGIQSMAQRANDNFLMTIADRTSLDQATPATNLWVDVTGERYEADKLDNNGSFKADMGYGAFGGDFALTEDLSAGAAVQYGKGTLRSNVSSIKNSIENYGVALYGAWTTGDAKITAEATYVKSENDIKSSQKMLERTVDADVWSLGVTGQMKFEAGAFRFVPSIGVRVSQLSTEGYKVGTTKIDRETQTYVQVPLALRMSGKLDTVAGWNIAPAAMLAFVPTFGDTDISVMGHDQDVLDKSPVQGRFGIRAQNGGLLLNADLLAGGGQDGRSAIGGKIGLRYTF